MPKSDSPFDGIENLLNLNDWDAEIGFGFWICIKAAIVAPDSGRPHGIDYALTLYDPSDGRLVGYDNAHAPDIGSGPSARSRREGRGWDHKHWRATVSVYNFRSAECLLEDFWADVERMLEEEGHS